MIANGAARKVVDARGNWRALGLTPNGRGIHVIEHGQDPSFTQVKVVEIATGRTLAALPFAGDGAYA